MPNYVANRVIIVGSDDAVKRVVEYVKGENGVFDFDRILPRPKSLNISSSTSGEDGMEYIIAKSKNSFLWSDKERKLVERMDGYSEQERNDRIALGKLYLQNLIDYGVTTWYEWNINNWGTKWNACDAECYGDGMFSFDTAWSAPLPVLKKLSEIFPDVEIDFVYADEDCSYNTGEGVINGGNMEANFPDGNSQDAWRLYFETHEWAREEMHQDETGNWVWND